VNPDVAAELRLLRAEIAALRHQDPPPPGPRPAWLPAVHGGQLILPEQHYRLLRAVRSRIFRRSAAGALPHAVISKQRRLALWLTIFAAVRTAVWLAAMTLIVAHWLGASGAFLHWFTSLSATVVFVTFISFYCNASTDAANMAAGFAALFSADSHAATVTAGRAAAADIAGVEADIARLADLQPGDEARALAAEIRRKLTGQQAEAA
jgi:ABC-type multidrug transport system fused ATPase/permease subunit